MAFLSFPVAACARAFRRALAIAVALAGAGVATASAAEPQLVAGAYSEDVVKSAFLYNFAKYVEWPASASASPEDPLIMCVIGERTLEGTLDDTLRDKLARGRPVTVRRIAEDGDPSSCFILFVPQSDPARLKHVLSRAEKSPVLTVGEQEGFCKAGGAVAVLIENEKPKLEVNPDAAESKGITIDAKLLRVATIVRTGK